MTALQVLQVLAPSAPRFSRRISFWVARIGVTVDTEFYDKTPSHSVSCGPVCVCVSLVRVSSSSVQRPPIPRWCPVRAWLFFTFLHTYRTVENFISLSAHETRRAPLSGSSLPPSCPRYTPSSWSSSPPPCPRPRTPHTLPSPPLSLPLASLSLLAVGPMPHDHVPVERSVLPKATKAPFRPCSPLLVRGQTTLTSPEKRLPHTTYKQVSWPAAPTRPLCHLIYAAGEGQNRAAAERCDAHGLVALAECGVEGRDLAIPMRSRGRGQAGESDAAGPRARGLGHKRQVADKEIGDGRVVW